MQTPWFENYGMVIGDEAHNFKAKSLTAILEKCVNAQYRLGTTGTLDGTQTHQLVLEGLFGPVHKVTTTKKLIEENSLSQLDIFVLLLKYSDEHCRLVSKMKYQEEIDFIVKYEPRNNFIANLAMDQEGNSLILFQFVDKHGKPLHDLLKKKFDELPRNTRRLFYVSGETTWIRGKRFERLQRSRTTRLLSLVWALFLQVLILSVYTTLFLLHRVSLKLGFFKVSDVD